MSARSRLLNKDITMFSLIGWPFNLSHLTTTTNVKIPITFAHSANVPRRTPYSSMHRIQFIRWAILSSFYFTMLILPPPLALDSHVHAYSCKVFNIQHLALNWYKYLLQKILFTSCCIIYTVCRYRGMGNDWYSKCGCCRCRCWCLCLVYLFMSTCKITRNFYLHTKQPSESWTLDSLSLTLSHSRHSRLSSSPF